MEGGRGGWRGKMERVKPKMRRDGGGNGKEGEGTERKGRRGKEERGQEGGGGRGGR